jgi:hypothetical protein
MFMPANTIPRVGLAGILSLALLAHGARAVMAAEPPVETPPGDSNSSEPPPPSSHAEKQAPFEPAPPSGQAEEPIQPQRAGRTPSSTQPQRSKSSTVSEKRAANQTRRPESEEEAILRDLEFLLLFEMLRDFDLFADETS